MMLAWFNPFRCSKFLSTSVYQIVWGPFANVLVSNQFWIRLVEFIFIPGEIKKIIKYFRVYLVCFSKSILILVFRCRVHCHWLTFSVHYLRAEILGRDAISPPSKSKHQGVGTLQHVLSKSAAFWLYQVYCIFANWIYSICALSLLARRCVVR